MSCTPVRPTLAAAASARFSASVRTGPSGGGTTAPTRSVAVSTNTPVGRPPVRTMRPPSGCQSPARSRRTRRMAAVFAQPAWPSTRSSQTGRVGKAASRSAAVGKSCSGQSFWSQPRPSSHAPAGRSAANACRRPMTSALLRVPTRSACISANPSPIRCACASIRPGTTVAPWASYSANPRAVARTSCLFPSRRCARPFQAIASAAGCASSWVCMRALTSTPAPAGAAVAEARPRASIRRDAPIARFDVQVPAGLGSLVIVCVVVSARAF